MRKNAILVEDEAQQAEFSILVLQSAGFSVHHFADVGSAREGIGSVPRPIDLVVLDRRLPEGKFDEPIDEHGDRLLEEWLEDLPDTPFVVFTGYTNIEHMQFSTRNRGTIDVGARGVVVDRVTPFTKSQTLEFEKFVNHLAEMVDVVADVEVIGLDDSLPSAVIDRRLLARVTLHFGGVALKTVPLVGGLTGMAVWHCTVLSAQSESLAAVVVKRVRRDKALSPGGFHTLLPAPYIAAPIMEVTGLCAGSRALVMQSADHAPRSAMVLLEQDEALGAAHLEQIARVQSECLEGTVRQRTIAEIAEPLGRWDRLEGLMREHGIPVPRGSMTASAKIAAQHGDLHPGNILVVNASPVLIDFDSETSGSMILDAVTALLSPIFHESSPLRGSEWPTIAQCGDVFAPEFLVGCPASTWVGAAQAWVRSMSESSRERWALALAYAVRQLRFKDVLNDARTLERAVAIARSASAHLDVS